jgi:hypothetical protein
MDRDFTDSMWHCAFHWRDTQIYRGIFFFSLDIAPRNLIDSLCSWSCNIGDPGTAEIESVGFPLAARKVTLEDYRKFELTGQIKKW